MTIGAGLRPSAAPTAWAAPGAPIARRSRRRCGRRPGFVRACRDLRSSAAPPSRSSGMSARSAFCPASSRWRDRSPPRRRRRLLVALGSAAQARALVRRRAAPTTRPPRHRGRSGLTQCRSARSRLFVVAARIVIARRRGCGQAQRLGRSGERADLVRRVVLVDLDALEAATRASSRCFGLTVSSAISRSATTGFLSRSRSMVSSAPPETWRARWAASRTRSKRFGNLVDTIFDGNARHEAAPRKTRTLGKDARLHARPFPVNVRAARPGR